MFMFIVCWVPEPDRPNLLLLLLLSEHEYVQDALFRGGSVPFTRFVRPIPFFFLLSFLLKFRPFLFCLWPSIRYDYGLAVGYLGSRSNLSPTSVHAYPHDTLCWETRVPSVRYVCLGTVKELPSLCLETTEEPPAMHVECSFCKIGHQWGRLTADTHRFGPNKRKRE